MPHRARLFVDFWNFQLQWNERTGKAPCDWPKLPAVVTALVEAQVPQLHPIHLDDTRVYASYNPDTEGNLGGWLDSFLNRQPGFRVFTRERRSRPRPIHCRSCGEHISTCPGCGATLVRAAEKGVDSAILTDMFSLAWENAYDVGVLVSGDADLIPAIERIQDRGFKLVNATWSGYGHDLAKNCWASVAMDSAIPHLKR